LRAASFSLRHKNGSDMSISSTTKAAVAVSKTTLPHAMLLPLFAGTLFISAGLMFLIEPMVAKMVLPQLGGSPAVWSTCLLFFQATLLLGYAYAHALTRVATRRAQIIIHVAVLVPLAGLSLPLDLGANLAPHSSWPAQWLLVRLTLAAGPVVFAISATAPLLQSWFSDLDHESAGDPYFLYASSNAGSLLALLSYPFLIEPTLPLHQQAALWSWGVVILAAGIILSGGVVFFGTLPATLNAAQVATPAQWRKRLEWTVLAFVPSSLLLGVTSYITTDVASAPLFWVVPLAIYLLTFILVFARRPPLPHTAIVRLMPFVLIPLVITMVPGLQLPLSLVLILHLSCLFVVAMVCHGELVRRRPSSERLTDFYFCVAVGGVLGGLFNALLAPVIFPDVWEYPIALVAACLVRPAAPEDSERRLASDILPPLALFALIFLARRLLPGPTEGSHTPVLMALFIFIVPGMALLNFWSRRLRFAAGVAACLIGSAAAGWGGGIITDRSFFGISRVRVMDDHDGRYIALFHGTTLHGVRSLVPGEERIPMAYYSPEGPFGNFFAALPVTVRHIGVIGLGTGELSCYATPGQDWTFYEIDPIVEQISGDPRYFQFLKNCGNHPHVIIGDARLTIANAPDGFYNALILDAFSSDSIPMHLITREAVALYLSKLAPDGRMLFHISSRRLDLREVVGSLAADAGLIARINFDTVQPRSTLRHAPALVVAMARDDGQLVGLDQAHGWQTLTAGARRFLWTDQRSDLLQVILWR
jgi:hypothetical protein